MAVYRYAVTFICVVLCALWSCVDDAFEEIPPEQDSGEAGLSYSDYIGAWEVTGDIYLESGLVRSCTYQISVEQKVKGLSYNVRGWSGSAVGFDFPLEMKYNSDGSVSISSAQVLGTYTMDGGSDESTVRIVMANGSQQLLPLNYAGKLSGTLEGDEVNFKTTNSGFGITYCFTQGDLAYYIAGDEFTLINPVLRRLPQTPVYYDHKEVITLQEHTKGDGINLYIVGDGYTDDYDFGQNGKFISDARGCAEAFFEVEPMKSLQDYFSVYVIASHSVDRGVSSSYSQVDRNTLFEVSFTNILSSSNIGVNYDKVHNFVYGSVSNPGIKGYNVIIVMVNQDESAGTAYLNSSVNHSNVAVVPITEKQDGYAAIVRHEAVGHAFGMLFDEYIYYGTAIPEWEKSEAINNIKEGFGANISFESRNSTHWAKYYTLPGYDMVGYFEGGLKYQYGVWRAEEYSCMDNNIPYFTAPSREKLYSRVMERSGIPFDFQEFLNFDKSNVQMSRSMVLEGYSGCRLKDDLVFMKNFSK